MELKAGRELDALVAEKVMGLPEKDWHPECSRYHQVDDAEFDSKYGWMGWCYTEGREICTAKKYPPRYSTDIAAAWEVVESDYWSEDWGIVKVDSAEPLYQVWDLPGWELETGLISQAYSSPLAICLAALKAVGYDESTPPRL